LFGLWLGIIWTLPVILGGVFAARIPDKDREPPLNLVVTHRGATHTLIAALISALLAVGIIVFAFNLLTGGRDGFTPSQGRLILTVFIGVFGGYLSHLFGDALTKSGINPFWPLSDREVRVAGLHSSSTLWNRIFLICGVSSLSVAVVIVGALA
jgi:membrane-bound metal-dependent hydrolase YbcI (DUF457 family)